MGVPLVLFLVLFLGADCGGGAKGNDGGVPDPPLANTNWLWSGRGAGDDYLTSVDAFPDDSIAVVGRLDGDVLLEGANTDLDLHDTGGSLLVARVHADGSLLWARTDGANSTVSGSGIVANQDGTCLVAGTFRGTATFGVGEASQTTLVTRGGDDIFLARYSAGGALDWVKQAGGTTPGGGYERLTTDTVSDMAGFADGSCVVVGHFSMSTTFGTGASRVDVTGSTGNSTYIARYAADGSILWADGINFTSSAYARVAARPDGSCAVTGLIPGPEVPGSGDARTRIGPVSLTRAADGWSFIAAYDASGAVLWAHGTGAGADLVPQDLTSLADGTLVVVGEMAGDPALVAGAPAVLTPPLSGRRSFIGRFEADGGASWVRKDDCVTSMRIENDERGLLVAGVIQSLGTLGAGSPTATVIDRNGEWGSFLARFDAGGALAWAHGDGGTGLNLLTHPGALALLPDGRIALAANFQGTAVLGEEGPEPAVLDSLGSWDFLLATYDALGAFQMP